ncbi:MAG: hypothetical protein WCG20_03055 [bacterium]
MFNLDKAKKNLKNTVMATVTAVTMAAPAFGAESKAAPIKDEAKIEATAQTPEEIEAAKMEKARLEKIANLEAKVAQLNAHMAKIQDHMEKVQDDFDAALSQAIAFNGGKHLSKLDLGSVGDTAISMARLQVGKHNLMNDNALNGLSGVLLSGEGRFGKQMKDLLKVQNGQIGSTVAMNGEKMSPDLALRQKIGADPRIIIQDALEFATVEHQKNLAQQELDKLMQDVTGLIASN